MSDGMTVIPVDEVADSRDCYCCTLYEPPERWPRPWRLCARCRDLVRSIASDFGGAYVSVDEEIAQ